MIRRKLGELAAAGKASDLIMVLARRHADDEHLVRAMHVGATSYLLKTAPAAAEAHGTERHRPGLADGSR